MWQWPEAEQVTIIHVLYSEIIIKHPEPTHWFVSSQGSLGSSSSSCVNIRNGFGGSYCYTSRTDEETFTLSVNPITPNDLQRRRAVSPLKIEVPSKNMRDKPTNATIIQFINYVW
jgi:hypothetical protein